jgi:hypothetical protein
MRYVSCIYPGEISANEKTRLERKRIQLDERELLSSYTVDAAEMPEMLFFKEKNNKTSKSKFVKSFSARRLTNGR